MGELVGPITFFTNFVEIITLLIAWVIVIVAFFILAVQMIGRARTTRWVTLGKGEIPASSVVPA